MDSIGLRCQPLNLQCLLFRTGSLWQCSPSMCKGAAMAPTGRRCVIIPQMVALLSVSSAKQIYQMSGYLPKHRNAACFIINTPKRLKRYRRHMKMERFSTGLMEDHVSGGCVQQRQRLLFYTHVPGGNVH